MEAVGVKVVDGWNNDDNFDDISCSASLSHIYLNFLIFFFLIYFI